MGGGNGKGELVSVEDAHGLITQYAYYAHGLITEYAYYADGSLQSVSRDAGRGLVQNRFTNDVLGRKIAQDDPDTGTSTFEYNANNRGQTTTIGDRPRFNPKAIKGPGQISETTTTIDGRGIHDCGGP